MNTYIPPRSSFEGSLVTIIDMLDVNQNDASIMKRLNKLDILYLFIDESYFYYNSGFVQSCVAISPIAYGNILPSCHKYLRILDKSAKEFKASDINKHNTKIYSSFLKLFTSALCAGGEIHSIISVDSYHPYMGGNYNFIYGLVASAMTQHNLMKEDKIIEELCRQIIWFYHHWHKIWINKEKIAQVVIIFDEKGDFANICNKANWISSKNAFSKMVPYKTTLRMVINSVFNTVATKAWIFSRTGRA